MSDTGSARLNEIFRRVSEEVSKEVGSGGAVGAASAFKVSDLRAQFADLVKGGEAAWTISYSTSSARLDSAGDLGRLGNAAWTISYSTSSAALGQKTGGG